MMVVGQHWDLAKYAGVEASALLLQGATPYTPGAARRVKPTVINRTRNIYGETILWYSDGSADTIRDPAKRARACGIVPTEEDIRRTHLSPVPAARNGLAKAPASSSGSVPTPESRAQGGYCYEALPPDDIDLPAQARIRKAYELACGRLGIWGADRPDLAICKETRSRTPQTIYPLLISALPLDQQTGSDHQLRGFCFYDQTGGIGVVQAQEPRYQVAATLHEIFHWAVLAGTVRLDKREEEESARSFGKTLARQLGY